MCSFKKGVILCVIFLPWLLPSVAPTDQSIIVGGTVSLEGKYSEPSLMIQNAYRLWEQEINARGGVLGRPVKLVLYNDKSRKELTKHFYEKLIAEDKVDLILSPYGTPLTLVASEVSERRQMVMLACSAAGESVWARGHEYVFGMYATANRFLIGLIDLMARNGLDSLAVIYEDSPFHSDVSEGIQSWAKRFGVTLDFNRSFKNGERDLSVLLRQVVEVQPDGIVLSAYPPECYEFLELAQEHAFRPRAFAMTIAPVHPDFVNHAGNMAEGVFAPSQWEPDERIPFPGTKRFIKKFIDYAEKRPSYHAGSAYAACQILERAIKKTESLNHKKIRDYILALDTVTVIGRFKVDHTGKQIGHNPILIQWQDGKKEIVYPRKMQTARPRF